MELVYLMSLNIKEGDSIDWRPTEIYGNIWGKWHHRRTGAGRAGYGCRICAGGRLKRGR